MEYGIMRVEKRRRSAVRGLQMEATRTGADHVVKGRDFARSDIDWSATDKNAFLRKCEDWNATITEQIQAAGIRERKDSVVLIDALYTASPAFFEGKSRAEVLAYFESCLAYHEREFGPAFSAVVHLDEATPHMQVASVPLVEDESGCMHLSAKRLLGNRKDYHARQDRFYEQVARSYGLDRGQVREPGALKEHLTKREWQHRQQAARVTVLDAKPAPRARRTLTGQVKLSEPEYVTLCERARLGEHLDKQVIEAEASLREAQAAADEARQERRRAAYDRRQAERLLSGDAAQEAQRMVQRAQEDEARAWERQQGYLADTETLRLEKAYLVSEVEALKGELEGLESVDPKDLDAMRAFCEAYEDAFEDFRACQGTALTDPELTE